MVLNHEELFRSPRLIPSYTQPPQQTILRLLLASSSSDIEYFHHLSLWYVWHNFICAKMTFQKQEISLF